MGAEDRGHNITANASSNEPKSRLRSKQVIKVGSERDRGFGFSGQDERTP